MNPLEPVGKLVLSPDFGAGIIIAVEELDSSSHQMFFVVEHESEKAKSYLPVDGKGNYRFLSAPTDLENLLAGLYHKDLKQQFESKKDRINYFRKKSKIHNASEIVDLISELSSLSDRGTIENQIYSKFIDSLALEYSIVIGKSIDDSKAIILNQLEK